MCFKGGQESDPGYGAGSNLLRWIHALGMYPLNKKGTRVDPAL